MVRGNFCSSDQHYFTKTDHKFSVKPPTSSIIIPLTNITNIYSLKNIEVLVPSKQIQKHIIDKAKDDDFDILTYLEEFYPHMSELIEKIEKLYSNSNYVPSSSSYYSSYGSVYVKGYRRKDGVYVRGHSRRK